MMYQGIYDMPIGKWWKQEPIYLVRFESLRFLFKSILKPFLVKRWDKIKAEFFDKIALNDELEKYLLKLVKLESIRVDIMLNEGTSRGNYLKTQYKIKEDEIKHYEIKDKKDNFQQKAILSKHAGFRIDENVTSIAEYYGYINDMREEYKRLKNG